MLIRESHMVEGTGEEGETTERWIDGEKKVCLHPWIVEICLQLFGWIHLTGVTSLFSSSVSFVWKLNIFLIPTKNRETDFMNDSYTTRNIQDSINNLVLPWQTCDEGVKAMIRHLLPPMINKLYMKSIPAPPGGLLPPSSSSSVLHLFAPSLCFQLIHPPLSSQEWRRGEGGGEMPPPLLLLLLT